MKSCVSKILKLAQETENIHEKNAYLTAASILIEEQSCTSKEHEACQLLDTVSQVFCTVKEMKVN